jgi:23S rRNA (adenine2030-N6)-methyltransferase
MLSYQHMYHAGSLADVHKHILLARALAHLLRAPEPLVYAETHAGRGRYFLDHPAAGKTGEAARGIQRLLAEGGIAADEPFLKALTAIRAGNPRVYPGSPLLAAVMLRPADRLWLWELHPREVGWLQRLFAGDARVRVHPADGTIGLPLRLPLRPPDPERGLILVDPSYEVKDEYDRIPAFVQRLRHRFREGTGILWYPMLQARRHVAMREELLAADPALCVDEAIWSAPDDSRGLYGSGIIFWNLPPEIAQRPAFDPVKFGSRD